MPPAPVTGCTCFRLRKLTRRLTQHYDAYLAPTGLRLTQYSLLANLARGGPATMSALADLLEMDRTTLTRNLKPLVQSGFVAVGAGSDGRERRVTMTEAGRAAWSAAREHWRRAQDEVNRALGADRVSTLHALLDDSLVTFKEGARAAPGSQR